MKNIPIKPLIIVVLCIGAGIAQAHAVSTGKTYGVPSLAQAIQPEATSYPIERHVYADTPVVAVTETLSAVSSTTNAAPVKPVSLDPVVATPTVTSVVTPDPQSVTPTVKQKQTTPAKAISVAPQIPNLVTTSYTVANGKIFAPNGQKIVLHGVNWFGFETGSHTVHGLWSRNWKEMVSQIKASGFNAVRLPICPATLNGASVPQGQINYALNPDLVDKKGQEVMDTIVTGLNNQGIYAVIDIHKPDCDGNISNLWYTSAYSTNSWIADLQNLAHRYQSLPYFLGLDLKNEPHGVATWGTGNLATDWNIAAESAGSAVLKTNPNLLIFVEGIQENPICSSQPAHFEGENFEPEACAPLNLPANKAVYSPHVYGPDVSGQSYFNDPQFPANMSAIWEKQFGFLVKKGFAVVPGEWGGKYGTGGGSSQDVALQDALTAYYVSNGICSSFYWSWNPNSGDTGGILEDDWQTVWPTKLLLLQNYWKACR